MRRLVSLSSILIITCLISCQSSDQKPVSLRGSNSTVEKTANAFAAFSSASDSSVQIRLQLYTDSTFELGFSSEKNAQARKMQGKLAITEDHYQLFFPDTVTQLNELITPVHHDASIVVYPDGSVTLDKALTQFFVEGNLIKIDTSQAKQ